MVIRNSGILLFAMTLLAGCSFTSIGPNPDHCVNGGGDDFCEERHHRSMFCSMGMIDCPGHESPSQDGCVDDQPGDVCYSPCGMVPFSVDSTCLGDDALGGASGSSGSTTSTGAETAEMSSTSQGDLPDSPDLPNVPNNPYPPCALGTADVCVMPYERCYQYIDGFNVCSMSCSYSNDCPQVDASASVSCVEIQDHGTRSNWCLLDCSHAETCPDGMQCRIATMAPGMPSRCVWPND